MATVRWVVFPKEDSKCFGCGISLRKSANWKRVQKCKNLSGDPHFVFTVQKQNIHVCPVCALLYSMKTNGDMSIREGEFNENTMANIHRKHKKEIIQRHLNGESYYDMIKSTFPVTKGHEEHE